MVQWQHKILSIPCSRREAPLATKKYQLECSSSYVRLVFVFEELTQESNRFHLTAQYFFLRCLYHAFHINVTYYERNMTWTVQRGPQYDLKRFSGHINSFLIGVYETLSFFSYECYFV